MVSITPIISISMDQLIDPRYPMNAQPTTVYSSWYYREIQQPEIKENKKERIARIAKEKMFASWKLYNEKREKVLDVRQMCKPRHRLNHSGSRIRH